MLAMAQINYINYLREVEGLTINSLAKQLGINWRTARKYADQEDWSPQVEKRVKHFPILGPYLDVIEVWLIEDLNRKRKLRHTNIRIYQRLRDECGYTGGVRTVTGYVSKRKKELKQDQKSYTELVHPGGEAQIDFGTTDIIYKEAWLQVKYLVMSFPYSNAAFLAVFPREDLTCFLEGLKLLFKQAGGVPRKLWFDNLSAAVVKIKGHGERGLTDMFQRFQLHYRFEAVFCNPRSGHEKGNVENKVGTSRRNWFIPIPVMTSWEQINSLMKQKAEQAMNHIHYKHKQSVWSLWEEEQVKLLEFPRDAFEVFQLETSKLDKYGNIHMDKGRVSVPDGGAEQLVSLKVYWNRVEVMNETYETIATLPHPVGLKQQEMDWIRELKQVKDKPRAIPYTMVYTALPEILQRYLDPVDLPHRKKRISSLIRWLQDGYLIDQIAEAIASISPGLWRDEGVVYQELYRTMHPETADYLQSLEEGYTPSNVRDYEPALEAYDTLTRKVWS
ncbi:IS21 family transposase [Lentibacillus cibarius]|uniref:IS21 family transposase n=1 Tax=Lentibacillus cibarius TaxID=2583219 RepID=A0A549YHY3_9BACI|nr:IS21 family transposase [Lentibacillus cibarius]TRM11491.1 IS21 family transposase [Lentibacillus cibarius]